MPRPRVRPEDRLRAAKACLNCKSSKKRCDGHSPCAHCVKRDLASSCSYTQSSRDRRTATPRMNPAPQSMSLSNATTESAQPLSFSTPSQQESVQPIQPDQGTSVPQRLTTGRLLTNSKGEQGTVTVSPSTMPLTKASSLHWQNGSHYISAVSSSYDQAANGPINLH